MSPRSQRRIGTTKEFLNLWTTGNKKNTENVSLTMLFSIGINLYYGNSLNQTLNQI